MQINISRWSIYFFLIFLTGVYLVALYYIVNIGNSHLEENARLKITKSGMKKWLTAALILFVCIALLYKYSILRMILSSAVFSMLLAFLINPIINFFERKKLGTKASIILIYCIMALVIVIIILGIIPILSDAAEKISKNFPKYQRAAEETFLNMERDLGLDRFGISLSNIDFKEIFFKNKNHNFDINDFFNKIWKTVISIPQAVLSIIFIFVFNYSLLKNKEAIFNRISVHLPKKYEQKFLNSKELLGEINQTMGEYLRGRFIMQSFVGICVTILLLIARVDFAIPIGIITFFADIIPYIGPFLGFFPAVFFAFISSPIKALVVAILFVTIQQLEGNLVQPKVLGKKLGMNPVLVFTLVIAGGGMFGLLGIIFIIPVAGIIQSTIRYFNKKNEGVKNERNGIA